jgi:formate dehydrogenase maturation protein FdhE
MTDEKFDLRRHGLTPEKIDKFRMQKSFQQWIEGLYEGMTEKQRAEILRRVARLKSPFPKGYS